MNNTNRLQNVSRRDVVKLGLSISPFLLSPAWADNDLFDIVNSTNSSTNPDKPMDKRAIPVSGELIPVIGLGTWRTFDAGNSKEKRKSLLAVLKTLNQKGASVIDSSP